MTRTIWTIAAIVGIAYTVAVILWASRAAKRARDDRDGSADTTDTDRDGRAR